MKRLLLIMISLCMAIAISKDESELIDNVEQLHKMLDDVRKTIIGQIDLIKIPITIVYNLGHCIENHPFTDEDKVALKSFFQYMNTIYVTQDQIENWLSSFSSVKHQRYSYLEYVPTYHLTDGERTAAANLVYEATEKVRINFDSVKNMFKRPDITNKMNEMQRKKIQLIEVIDRLKKSLEHGSDGDLELGKVMSESVKEIAEHSNELVTLSESFVMIQMLNELARYIVDIVDAMKDLPMNLSMAYML